MINIDDKIDLWHTSENCPNTPLYEFLGMTLEEYSDWVRTDKLPDRLRHVYYQQ